MCWDVMGALDERRRSPPKVSYSMTFPTWNSLLIASATFKVPQGSTNIWGGYPWCCLMAMGDDDGSRFCGCDRDRICVCSRIQIMLSLEQLVVEMKFPIGKYGILRATGVCVEWKAAPLGVYLPFLATSYDEQCLSRWRVRG